MIEKRSYGNIEIILTELYESVELSLMQLSYEMKYTE